MAVTPIALLVCGPALPPNPPQDDPAPIPPPEGGGPSGGGPARRERREARYQRRQARRLENKRARCESLGGLEKAFSYRKMFFYGKRCCNGVGWKQSTQNYGLHLFSGTARRRKLKFFQ